MNVSLPMLSPVFASTASADAHVPRDLAQALERLRNTHLFEGLETDALRTLAACCREIALGRGDIAIRQGDEGHSLFIVLEGRLEVFRETESSQHQVLGEVRRGEYFGEVALLRGVPRMATVRATTEATLLALDRASLETFLGKNPTQRETMLNALEYRVKWAQTRSTRPSPEKIIEALGELTGGLPREALAKLEDEVEWTTLPRGAVLMRQGEEGNCLYLVVGGRLSVFGHREDGGEVAIGEIGPGESVGEMALLSNEPRSASVAATRESELLCLTRVGFERLVREHPATMMVFARQTVERLSRRIRARAVVSQLRANPLATPEECEEITRTDNLILRNLKITQMYYRLSLQIALMIGQQDANWCTFACSASKTAGYSIRRQELPFAEVLTLLKRSSRGRESLRLAETLFGRSGLKAHVDDILDAVSETISAGNLKVFAELAPVFARMTRTFYQDTEYDRAKLDAFLATLRPGPTDTGGQDLLAEAISHYYEAMFEVAHKRRAELILLGNVKIGLHEQTRLQPNIVEALNAPMHIGLGRMVSTPLGSVVEALPAPLRRLAIHRVSTVERTLLQQVTAVWRQLVTRRMMTLRLPYGDVRLGRDVPRLPNAELFPDVLQELSLPELVRVVHQFDSAPGELAGSRASDWGSLTDRMNFIVDLFRSRQKSLELFDQPFLYQQRISLESNVVPHGMN